MPRATKQQQQQQHQSQLQLYITISIMQSTGQLLLNCACKAEQGEMRLYFGCICQSQTCIQNAISMCPSLCSARSQARLGWRLMFQRCSFVEMKVTGMHLLRSFVCQHVERSLIERVCIAPSHGFNSRDWMEEHCNVTKLRRLSGHRAIQTNATCKVHD